MHVLDPLSLILGLLAVGCFLTVLGRVYHWGNRRTAVLLGALTFVLVGPLLTFVYGARQRRRYQLQTTMRVWLACILLGTAWNGLKLGILQVQRIREEAARREGCRQLKGVVESLHTPTPPAAEPEWSITGRTWENAPIRLLPYLKPSDLDGQIGPEMP